MYPSPVTSASHFVAVLPHWCKERGLTMWVFCGIRCICGHPHYLVALKRSSEGVGITFCTTSGALRAQRELHWIFIVLSCFIDTTVRALQRIMSISCCLHPPSANRTPCVGSIMVTSMPVRSAESWAWAHMCWAKTYIYQDLWMKHTEKFREHWLCEITLRMVEDKWGLK